MNKPLNCCWCGEVIVEDKGSYKYRHITGNILCDLSGLKTKPQCHICKTTTGHHKGFCSAIGQPTAIASIDYQRTALPFGRFSSKPLSDYRQEFEEKYKPA